MVFYRTDETMNHELLENIWIKNCFVRKTGNFKMTLIKWSVNKYKQANDND